MTLNANPVIAGWSMSRTPSNETTTVSPAKTTARPAVAIAVSDGAPRVQPVGEAARGTG